MQSGTKNPPWARSNVNSGITGLNPQIMDPNAMTISQQGMMPFQQSQAVFNPNMMQAQSGISMSMAGQMQMNQMQQSQMYPGNVVAYPTPRAINSTMYHNTQASQNSVEQRVFTGTVTKTHNDFGFVDHDVFYQTSVCAKGMIPKVNDRVLVEASYNANMPFKWNATRVQILPKTSGGMSTNKPLLKSSNNYNAVPPPSGKKSLPSRRDDRPPRREDRKRSRTRSRSHDRKDNRSRRDSPPRKRPIVRAPSPTVKYFVRVPRIALEVKSLDVPSLSQRYTNMYIPSDFFGARVRWGETFPPQNPLSLNSPCSYHIMSPEIENIMPNEAVLEPPDADYRYSAKVMLLSVPTLVSLYQKCGLAKGDEKDKHSSQKSSVHPTRLIKFLVGHKGKGGENFAIGGPWSPSLDGENPNSDPKVLVKTAIRTCKALTGIDLTSCTQWYRMVEFYYWREGSGGKSQLECVVLFLPDVWSAQPQSLDWEHIQERYKAATDAAISCLEADNEDESPESSVQLPLAAAAVPEKLQIAPDVNSSTIIIAENDEDNVERPEPTHYSEIDLKTFKVEQLRQELKARRVNFKGLRAQLVSRLAKLLKVEEDKERSSDMTMETDDDDDNKEEPEVKETQEDTVVPKDDKEEEKTSNKSDKIEKKEKKEKKDEKQMEKERAAIKASYAIPSTPHIIVHPNKMAKGGRFNCNVATLSLLLDYRTSDNKEHSFELFVFAEIFNEMMMRDFGFYIYKTLYTLPEIFEESETSKDKKDDKTEKKEDKSDKKDDKKDDKRDDKRDSKRKDTKDSRSDDGSRSMSPSGRRILASRGVNLPADPYLLLSLVYFDTSRCGYIIKKDLNNLFMSLGLQLSRSQITNILEKVCVKNNFSYKNLIQTIKDISAGSTDALQDLPLDSTVIAELPTNITELESTIAAGNRSLLPVFDIDKVGSSTMVGDTKVIDESGMVMFKNRLVDVGALLEGLQRSEQQRSQLGIALTEARTVARTMRQAAAQTQAYARANINQVADLSAQLSAAKARITSLMASSKIFHSVLKGIQTKVDAVVNIKYEEDDDVEIINGPTKIEDDTKKEIAEPIDKKEVKEANESEKDNKEDKNDVIKEDINDINKEMKDSNKEVKEHKIQPNNVPSTKVTRDDIEVIPSDNIDLEDK